MPTRPTGTITFLFTDIEGSTRLLQRLGDQYADVLAAHFEILRDVLVRHGGHEEGTEGDAIFAVFPGAVEAVTAAVDAQRRFGEHSWPSGTSVRVRMGLHSGEAAYGEDGYVGIDVHRAARISSAAHGGQIVLSASTATLVATALPVDVTLQTLGSHRLKDLGEAELLSQVVASGLDKSFPPLRSLDSVPHNLPTQLTDFIGRAGEMRDVSRLVSENRLVTLTGVGGTGKTRLALQVGAEVVEDFPDGVWIVDLVPVADGEMVDNAVAAALGVRDQPGRSLLETIGDAVRTRKTLIILDNCEHLIRSSADVVSGILHAGPDVRVLATSREPLGVPGEVMAAIPPLAAPPQSATTADALAQYDSTVLFENRAALARPGFRITDENSEAVAQICRSLDAVPLAIELAAARVRVLSPSEIADHLEDRFRLLTGGGKTAVPRQQTLEATVAWSYDHLSDAERLLFSRLAVFAGNFTLDSAEAVTDSEGIERWDVLDLVTGLVEKSMLVVDSDDYAKSRYRVLETLRQYGMSRLIESGTADVFRRKHAVYFADLAERGDRQLRGPHQGEWFTALGKEHDNFAAALTWTLGAEEGELFLRTTSALGYFWGQMGLWEEGRNWLLAGPTTDETQPADLRAKALIQAVTVIVPEDPERALETAKLARELSQAADEKHLAALALNSMGYVSMLMLLVDEATTLLEESVAMFRSLGDRWGEALALGTLSNTVSYTGGDSAEDLSNQSLRIFEELGDRLGTAESLDRGAKIADDRDDPRHAVELSERALALYLQLGSSIGQGHSLLSLGRATAHLGQPGQARQSLHESLKMLNEVGDARCSARVQYELGSVDLSEDDLTGAIERFREALAMSSRIDDKLNITRALDGMGQIALANGDAERATVLFAATEQLRDPLKVLRARDEERRHEGRLETLRRRLNASSLDAAWTRGEDMDTEEAVAFAVEYTLSENSTTPRT